MLAYAAVNPLDIWVTKGNFQQTPLPFITGTEGLGTCSDGRRVVVRGCGLGVTRPGTYATRVVVPADLPVEVPDGVDDLQAAVMGIAGVTAWRVVTGLTGTNRNDVVLVLGASGGVGSLCVQIARACGARVIGQTGAPGKIEAVEANGADRVVVASNPGELLAGLGNEHPTVAYDCLGWQWTQALVEVLAEHGRLAVYGTSANQESQLNLKALYRKGISISGYGGIIEPPEAQAAALADMWPAIIAGQLRMPIEAVLPLEAVNEAHRRLLDRSVVGKLVMNLLA